MIWCFFWKCTFQASGVDLPAFNVQRAREKGIQPYNEIRWGWLTWIFSLWKLCALIYRQMIPNLGRVASFDALSANMDKANIDLLKKTYESVEDVDLYVGLLLERITDPTALVCRKNGQHNKKLKLISSAQPAHISSPINSTHSRRETGSSMRIQIQLEPWHRVSSL